MGYAYPPQIADLLSGCACAIIFILFLSLDAWKAIKRKSYWFPGAFLVLSALTLQFVNYVDYSPVSISSGIEDITDADAEKFLKIQLVIDSGRLVICVFIAYLLPGLARSGFRSVWADLGALTLNVLSHMFSEIYLVIYLYNDFPNEATEWFEAFSAMVFIAIILLVLLSISAVLAGKTIHILMEERVSSLLECCSNSPTNQDTVCENVGRHVLKCWIIARSSQPEDVVARSVLSSFAGFLVTVCIVVFAVKWKCVHVDHYKTVNGLNKATLVLQFIFSLMGWILVFVRWLRAVIYFPIDGRSLFGVEDFWTRCIIDLKYGQLNSPLFREARYRNRTLLENNIMDFIIAFGLLSSLLFIASGVQKVIVISSKALCLLSWIMLSPLLMIHKTIMFLCGADEEPEFQIYVDLLDKIRMPGEMAENMWTANKSAFKSTKEHIEQGRGSTTAMIQIISHITRPAAYGGQETQVEEETYFKYIGKKSWKMEAVSLIHFMLSLYDDNNSPIVDEAMNACSEAWPLMDFVETSDTEVNLLSLAADKDFHTLENMWKKMISARTEVRTAITDRIRDRMQNRIREGESQVRVNTMQDSMDWVMAAANFSLNKTSQRIGFPAADVIENSRYLLAKVIVDCWAKARHQEIIIKCNKWAMDGKEQEIYHAAFIAGKVMSLTDILQEVTPAGTTGNVNNAVTPAVTTGNVNNAVTPAEAVENGNNGSGSHDDLLDIPLDIIEEAIQGAGGSGDDNNG